MLLDIRVCVALLILTLQSSAIHAQPAAAWAGEWGAFREVTSPTGLQFRGGGLSIGNCKDQRCTFSIAVNESGANGGGEGFLILESPADGTAHLLSQGVEHCTLRLSLVPVPETITVSRGMGDCSYFLTPGATFERAYGLHTHAVYVGGRLSECFAGSGSAIAALCTDMALSALRDQWQALYWQVADLNTTAPSLRMTQEQAARTGLIKGCDGSAQVAECLKTAFTHSTAELEGRKSAWLQSVTDPGETAAAGRAAATIAGNYRRRFRNSDVQGDNFFSTDTIRIRLEPAGAISYSLHLEFYNGHECSLEGSVTYRHAGFFVDQKQTDDPKSPICVFEIISASNGIKLADPTGACRNISCGARGGYNGTEFSFKERRAARGASPAMPRQ